METMIRKLIFLGVLVMVMGQNVENPVANSTSNLTTTENLGNSTIQEPTQVALPNDSTNDTSGTTATNQSSSSSSSSSSNSTSVNSFENSISTQTNNSNNVKLNQTASNNQTETSSSNSTAENFLPIPADRILTNTLNKNFTALSDMLSMLPDPPSPELIKEHMEYAKILTEIFEVVVAVFIVIRELINVPIGIFQCWFS